jgi:hypothetical protein
MNGMASLIATIEAHLAAHPQAADSVDGVAEWWVARRGVVASREEVEEALDTLVRQGRLRCVRLADGNTLYCSAPQRDWKPSSST